MGAKCDHCEPYFTNLSSFGCQPCSNCEQGLRANLSSSRAEQNHLYVDLMQLVSLQQANASGLEDMFVLIRLLQKNVTLLEEYLETVEDRLIALISKAADIASTINTTAERVSNILSNHQCMND